MKIYILLNPFLLKSDIFFNLFCVNGDKTVIL